MKNFVKKIMVAMIVIMAICSCSTDNVTEFILPTFKPLDNTEDIVLITNSLEGANENEIIAIDTKASKVKQIYNFCHHPIMMLPRTTKNNVISFSYLSNVVALNTLTGKMGKIFNSSIWDVNINNYNIIFTNDFNHTESYSYNPTTNKLKQFNTYGAISSEIVNINDCSYCVTYIGNFIDFSEKTHYTIYDISNEKEIKLTYELEPFEVYCNKYLISNNNDTNETVIHEIISFEPENLRKIGEIRGFVDDIDEDDINIYVGLSRGAVIVIRKSDNKIIAQSGDYPEIDSPALTVLKNGYAWVGAGTKNPSGSFYRIDTVDYDEDGVLNWELVKYNK